MLAQLPRILFAAASSGSGKTTVTSGILRCLARRSLNVHAFKCGPDYIDPMFHRSVLHTPCRNLDLYFSTEEQVRTLLAESSLVESSSTQSSSANNAATPHQQSSNEPLAVLEGVMGYYDGLGGTTETASAYHVASATNTPVVLIADGRGASLTLVAALKGIVNYRTPCNIAGIIINRCTKSLAALLSPLIEQECGVPVVGYVPNNPNFTLESRHLGLVSASEVTNLQQRIDEIANTLEQTINLDALLTIARKAPTLEYQASSVFAVTSKQPLIAVARDEAFCFYYEESLEMLRALGATLEFFSPIAGETLPKGTCGVYLGGGYPELHSEALTKNETLAHDVRTLHASGMPIFAECGGFMYLQESLTDIEGTTWPMASVLPGHVHYTKKLSRFGYIELSSSACGMGVSVGDTLRAHEFHYFDSTGNGSALHATKYTGKQWDCCVVHDRLFAGFPHFYLPNCQKLACGFVEAAAAFQQEFYGTTAHLPIGLPHTTKEQGE